MRVVIHLILALVAAGLVFAIYGTIREPIRFRKEYRIRKQAVVEKLKDIRTAEKLYRGITDTFAGSFDDLKRVLSTEKFRILQVIGDRDALDAGEVKYDTLYVSAVDSLKSLGLSLEGIEKVPYSGGKVFDVYAGKVNQQGIEVPVVEVSTTYKDFMGEYGKKTYKKYDPNYDPDARLKFGSRTKLNLSGNWE